MDKQIEALKKEVEELKEQIKDIKFVLGQMLTKEEVEAFVANYINNNVPLI